MLIERTEKEAAMLPKKETSRALMTLGLVLAYVVLADRAGFFVKTAKTWHTPTFVVIMLLLLAAGAATWKKNSKNSNGFLNREQTDEWKGWMQVIILVYHFTGASSVMAIYNCIHLSLLSYNCITKNREKQSDQNHGGVLPLYDGLRPFYLLLQEGRFFTASCSFCLVKTEPADCLVDNDNQPRLFKLLLFSFDVTMVWDRLAHDAHQTGVEGQLVFAQAWSFRVGRHIDCAVAFADQVLY